MPDTEPMDVPAVLKQLNRALPMQQRSALQYLLVAGGCRGTHALAVGEELWRYAQAEFGDTRLLISKIVALGGAPNTETAPTTYNSKIKRRLPSSTP